MNDSFQRGTGGFINPQKIAESFGINPGMKIAHFGCGHGFFTLPMAKIAGNDGSVYAIDVLDSAIEAVKSRAKIEGVFNVECLKGDLETKNGSGLPDTSVDMVLLANILYQTPKKIEVMKEAGRVLIKEGTLVIIDWLEDSFFGPARETRISKETSKRLAEAEGFRLIREFSAGEFHYGIVMAKMM